MTDRRRRLLLLALSAGGVAFFVVQYAIGRQLGLFGIPGGDIVIWDRAGDDLRSGLSPYYRADPVNETFWYAPPWAVLFALVTWLPPIVVWSGMFAANLLGLRYLGGVLLPGRARLGVGLLCWFPFMAFELFAANINILIAAGIVAAVRGRPEVAAWTAFAKLSPVVAIRPRDWRSAAVVGVIALALTLPVLQLWPEWVSHLSNAYGQPIGPQVGIPFVIRAAVAAVLLVLNRPWSIAAAAMISVPAFYWGSFVLALAPLVVLASDRSRHAPYTRDVPDAADQRPSTQTPASNVTAPT